MINDNVCKMRILSEEYRDFIVGRGKVPALERLSPEQLCQQEMEYGYRSVYVSSTNVEPLSLERFPYNAIPNCYTLLDMEALNQAGITQIQNYPTLQLQGQRVMIGFLDTGIDYQNPIFRNLDGSTRIEAIWDQTIQTGKPPEGFKYGSVYTSGDIDRALRTDEPEAIVPTKDEDGHGTFLASVAAGGGDVENQFLGAAPEATLAVVKLKQAKQYLKDYYFIREDAVCYQENDIMIALAYLQQLATEKNMPLVFCIALGTNMGGHDTTTPLTRILEIYASVPNRAVVIGGGNEANQRHHYQGVLKNKSDIQEVEIKVDSGVKGFILELWTDIPNILAVSIISPSGERVPKVPIRQSSSSIYHFIFERTTVNIEYNLLVENTNSELVLFRFELPSPGIWRILVEPVQLADGIYHMWLPMTEFLSGETYFLQSNPDYTLTSPGDTMAPITVAFYNGADNSIDINSGRGYTRSDRIKPSFATPGVQVLGVTNTGQFVRRTGSSVATGITAGAAALLLEWVVYQLGQTGVDSLQIKNMMILGTSRKPTETYPNKAWGYGALNLYRTFDEIRQY